MDIPDWYSLGSIPNRGHEVTDAMQDSQSVDQSVELIMPDRKKQMMNMFMWSLVSSAGIGALIGFMMIPEGILFAVPMLPVFITYMYVRVFESYVSNVEVEVTDG